jgi:hypothetical protein
VQKAASNALRVQLATSDGTELGRAAGRRRRTVLAVIQPHSGFKADRTWHHGIVSPAGDELGFLTLMTVHTGWRDIDSEAMQLLFDYNVNTQKLPSAGALLRLRTPVAPVLGDVMAAACVDFSVLPRGYVA